MVANNSLHQMKVLSIIMLLFMVVYTQTQGQYSLIQFVSGITNYPNITFKITQKLISIRGGCNIQTGYFNVSSQTKKVAIGPFTSTRMACDKDYDSELVSKLKTVSKYNIATNNNTLTLLDNDDKEVAKCSKIGSNEVIDINKIINQMKGISTTNNNVTASTTFASTKTITSASSASISLTNNNGPQEQQKSNNGGSNNIAFNSQSTTSSNNSQLSTSTQTETSTTNTASSASTSTANPVPSILLPPMSIPAPIISPIPSSNTSILTTSNTTSAIPAKPSTPAFPSNASTSTSLNISTSISSSTSSTSNYISLQGNYSVNNLQSTPQIIIQIQDNQSISILGGCNIHSGLYSAYDNGLFHIVGDFFSTKRACSVDNDNVYLNGLKSSDNYMRQDKDILLRSGTNLLMRLVYVQVNKGQPSSTVNKDATSSADTVTKSASNTNGSAINKTTSSPSTTTQSNSTFTFSPSNINRYNTTTITYNTTNYNTPSTTTTTPTSIVPSAPIVTPAPVIVTPSTQPAKPQPLPIIFSGNYSTSNLTQQFTISFSTINSNQQSISISGGCNSFTSTYQAYNNGTFLVNGFVGTQKYCFGSDYDYVILNALSDTFTWSCVDNDKRDEIALKDDTGVVTVVLRLIRNNNVIVINGSNGSTKNLTSSTLSGNTNTNTNISTSSNNSNGNIINNKTISTNINNNNSIETTVIVGPPIIPIPTIPSQQQPLPQPYYSLTAALKIFQSYTVINSNDPYLESIQQFLSHDYYYFMKDNTLVAGFHKYRTSDNTFEYQLIIKSIFGTFNAILDYRINNQKPILLKSLAIISIESLITSYDNCQTKDIVNRNCISCSKGYGNFKGRCYLINANCSVYIGDECYRCKNGSLSTKAGLCK